MRGCWRFIHLAVFSVLCDVFHNGVGQFSVRSFWESRSFYPSNLLGVRSVSEWAGYEHFIGVLAKLGQAVPPIPMIETFSRLENLLMSGKNHHNATKSRAKFYISVKN